MTRPRHTASPSVASLGLVVGLLVVAGTTGCEDEVFSSSTFYDDVKDAYDDCDDAEIQFLTAKHGIQTAFRRCGSNHFGSYRWGPDGIHVYFQVTHAGHILNGEDKTIITVPTAKPVTNGAWLDADRILAVLPPPEGETRLQVAVYDRARNEVRAVPTDLVEPQDLHVAGGTSPAAYLTALDSSGVRRPVRLDVTTGVVEPAFPWLTEPVEAFTWEPKQGVVTWSAGGESHLARQDGTGRKDFPDALRAVLHPEGRYVMLERLGAPVSLFDQVAWDALAPEVRERKERRRDLFVERLPDWAPKEVQPPSFDLYDLQRDVRYRFTEFQGDQFQWYPARDFYGCFRMWGVEEKELNPNVALLDLTDRLRLLERDQAPRGIEVLGATATPAPAGAEAPLPAP